jgi:hypothetical protein
MARNRTRSDDKQRRSQKAPAAAERMPGLRWVPVPLAVLMAVIGWLVFGSALGQHALAVSQAGPEQGGFGLTVNQVVWMQSDMADPGKANPNAFQMPDSMMPGMQTGGDKRLRVEFYLRNISSKPLTYGLEQFRLLGTGHQSWSPLDNAATRGAALKAILDPSFSATVDLYFDLPSSQKGALRLEWSAGGHLMTIPLHIGNVMVGM